MCHPRLDYGEAMLRAARAAMEQQQQELQRYSGNPYSLAGYGNNSSVGPDTPGERPAPEDTTGLKLLEEFLTKRRSARDDDDKRE